VPVRLNSAYQFFFPDGFAIVHCRHRRSPTAHFTLLGALIIVIVEPFVQIFIVALPNRYTEVKNGKTLSFNRPAAVIGVLVVYSLAKATFE